MPAIFKNQPDHPSSSFEHGVRANVGNQISQWVLFVAIIGSFIATLGYPFMYIAIWHGAWWAIITLWTISARYFIVQSTNLRLDRWEDGDAANWENIFLYASAWQITLFGLIFRPDWKLARNRYVWWKGKAYIFAADKANPLELWSNNPILLLWIRLFRSADQYDQHACLIDREVAKVIEEGLQTPLQLPAAKLLSIDDFRSNVEESLVLYNTGVTRDRDPQEFVNQFVKYNWKNKPLSEAMKGYLIKRSIEVLANEW